MGIIQIYENVKDFLTPDLLKKVYLDNYEKKETKKTENVTTEFGDDFDPTNDFYDISGQMDYFNTVYDDRVSKNINEMIVRYRKASFVSYVNKAINEITNEAVLQFEANPVHIDFNDEKIKNSPFNLTEGIKKTITEEFIHLLNVIDFDQKGNDYFRRWYIDGRLYTQIVVKPEKLTDGIQKIKAMSPLWIKRAIDQKTKKRVYVYEEREKPRNNRTVYERCGIPEELVIFTPSGFYDYNTNISLSYMQPAMKDISRLDMLEDHVLIYAITRAPERRIFKVEVGALPPTKAKEKLQQFISSYKQDRVFDESTGTLGYKPKRPSMIEDFFMMQRDGKGTNIDTLTGGNALTEIKESLQYFAHKAYRSLNVPIGRMDTEHHDAKANVHMSNDEITKDELKFFNYISKLRRNFSGFFYELLKRQLVYKKIIKLEDWNYVSRMIFFKYESNLEFVRARDLAQLNDEVDLLRNISEYEGRYYSRDDIYKRVLGKSDYEIEEFEKTLVDEKKKYPQKMDAEGTKW